MIVDCALYEAGHRVGAKLALDEIDAAAVSADPSAFVWLGMHEPTSEELAAAAKTFSLHPLAVEDAYKAHQRPKIEGYGDDLFVVLRTLRASKDASVTLGEVLCFIGSWYIVIVRHGTIAELTTVRKHMESQSELLAGGPLAVLHEVADRVVDEYAPALDRMEEAVESVELEVFSDTKADPSEPIYRLKRQVLHAVRVMVPLTDVLRALAGGEFSLVAEERRRYFRDVYDHAVRALEQAVGLREQLTSIFEANMARISMRQNQDMRKISAWVAIFVAPTLVAGIYGMNFENMPELRSRYGYYFVLGGIALFCATLYALFRRSKWL